MTERQKYLAPLALGLRKGQKVSYRNRFVGGPGHDDYPDWMAMVAAGEAHREDSRLMMGSYFSLTLAGAKLALNAGEKLDREDFPEAA